MLQELFLKQMLKRQGVPAEQVEMILGIVKKNPELFKQIGEEAQAKIKSGMSQQEAIMAAMAAHQDELAKLKPE